MAPVTWHAQKILEPYGYRMRFLWTEPEFEAAVDHITLPGWPTREEGDFDVTFAISRGESSLLIQRDDDSPHKTFPEQLPDRLKSLAHLDLATYAPDRVFVHAGVVHAGAGLILIPGTSHTGKSTLTQALIAQGCRYYSDEYAVIRADGRVEAFPRPLSQRLGPGEERHIPAEELGWSATLEPAPVLLVVSTRYERGSIFEPETLSPGQAVLELFANTVSAQIAPALAMQRLPIVAAGALCLKGVRGEAPETAQGLLGLLSKAG